MFSYGFLSVVLALYLSGLGFSVIQIGVLFTVALAGGAVVTAGVTMFANRWERRTILIASSILMALGGVALASGNYPLMLIFAALATLSPNAQEIGPFQSLEQAALSEASADLGVVMSYAWYNLVGYIAVAVGALVAGVVPTALQAAGWPALEAQRVLLWAFAVIGLTLAGLYLPLSTSVEGLRQRSPRRLLGLHRSRGIVIRLTALFGIDALAGGLIVQSLVAYWFHQRFGIGLAALGPLFFGTNLLSALSSLVAAALAERIGLLNTMVFTHLPSNVLLVLVPFMPSWPVAAAVLLARHALSQMDVPTRQAYTMVLVAPEERVGAAGLTNAVRPAAASLAPVLSGIAFQAAANGLPFILAGGIKILYDLALWSIFRRASLAQHTRDAVP